MANVFIGGIGSARRKSPATKNQYYGRLNKRYDERADYLLRTGFVWDKENAIWHLNTDKFTVKRSMTGEFVMHAGKRAFEDRLMQIKFTR